MVYTTFKGVDNVIFGSILSDSDVDKLIAAMVISKGEIIHLLWQYDEWGEDVSFDSALVGITSKKVFKFENNVLQEFDLNLIAKVSHEKMGIFKWDRLCFEFEGGRTDWLGIYHSSACGYFSYFINEFLKKSPEERRNVVESGSKVSKHDREVEEVRRKQELLSENVEKRMERKRVDFERKKELLEVGKSSCVSMNLRY